MQEFDRLADRIVQGFGLLFEDAVAWAAGIHVESAPTPWFERAEEYGERAWRVVGKEVAVVCWDCGNGWMSLLTLEPLRPVEPATFRAAAVRFFGRLEEAVQDPDLNGGYA